MKSMMNSTQPRGFMSPKNSNFNNTKKAGELNKQDIREVVKSYFDKNSHNRNLSPTAAGGSSPLNR